jgi:large subunit ribosomal protein L6
MSRIGKKPILIPQGVEIEIKDSVVTIKGPKGEISQEIPPEILIEKKEDKIIVSPKRKTKRTSALWGLTRALLQNHVKGVTEGFEKQLEIRGIGYKASLEGAKTLKLEVGFSHPVKLEIPEDLKVSVEKNIIKVSGIDKQKVGEFAAKIRRVRPPEPYKGKGIRYVGEKVRKKEGKKAAATTG